MKNYDFVRELPHGIKQHRSRTETNQFAYEAPDGRVFYANSNAKRRFARLLCQLPGQLRPNFSANQADSSGGFRITHKQSRRSFYIITLDDLRQALSEENECTTISQTASAAVSQSESITTSQTPQAATAN